MTTSLKQGRDRREGERGYALVALLAVMFVLALAVTAAAPRIQQQTQRELEKEAIARGEEVAEAIAVYTRIQRALGNAQPLPTSLDDLIRGVTPPNSVKEVQLLRHSAAIDPLSGREWKLVRTTDRAFTDFTVGVVKYNSGTPPQQRLYTDFPFQPAAITNLVDLQEDDEPPGGIDTETSGSGPFVGVVSRSRRKSVLTFYGIERHDRWVFTPIFR